MRTIKTVIISVTAAAAMAAPAAQAAVTVGSNLAADGADNLPGYCPGASTCTGMNLSLPAASSAPDGISSPIDGVIVKFAVKSASAGNPVTLRVLRPAGGASYTGAGTGAGGTTTTGIAEFDAQLPIQAGDSIGLDIGNSALVWATTPSASGLAWGTVNGFPSGLADGTTAAGDAQASRELLLQARIEPDVDSDGLGDETQDPDVVEPDTTSPVISQAKAKRKKITYRLSEAATVTVTIKRKGKLRTLTRAGSAGKNTIRRRLRVSSRITLVAVDAAGNSSEKVKLRFKARKRR